MGKLNLSVAVGNYDRNRPLIDGAVQIDGVDPTFMTLEPEEIFFRALRHEEFDICELSLSSFTVKTAQGNCPYVGVPAFLTGAVAVGLISASYQAEVFRGSFLAVAPGEIEAARAIGMSRFMRFRRIIVPQVLRFALPGLGNVMQLSLKDSALISVTGLAELMRSSQVAAGSTRLYFTFYIAGCALYLVLTTLSDRGFAFAEKRVGRSFRGGIGR